MSSTSCRLSVVRLPHGADLPLPEAATDGAAGLDLLCAVPNKIKLEPGERAAIPTGLAVAVPEGWELQVRARSGLARRHGLALVNGVGTIDSDYRGEILVLLINLGSERVELRRGERIAQVVLAEVVQVNWDEVKTLDKTERGDGGFGHTG